MQQNEKPSLEASIENGVTVEAEEESIPVTATTAAAYPF